MDWELLGPRARGEKLRRTPPLRRLMWMHTHGLVLKLMLPSSGAPSGVMALVLSRGPGTLSQAEP
jgi:hypothetical protein